MTIQIVNVKIALVKIVSVGKESKMIKKLFLVLTLLFTWSCEDLFEEEYPMKLWLNGEEIDVQAEDGIRDRSPSRGLGDVYKRQVFCLNIYFFSIQP